MITKPQQCGIIKTNKDLLKSKNTLLKVYLNMHLLNNFTKDVKTRGIPLQTGTVQFDDIVQMMSIFGPCDENVKAIEQSLDVTVNSRDSNVEVRGETDEAVHVAIETIETLKKMFQNGEPMNDWAVSQALDLVRNGEAEYTVEVMKGVVAITQAGKPVRCKTIGQRNYIKAIQENTITVCIGPAGTGKTYLAIAMAVKALKNKEVSRIILTRPAVEAGEKLGFLPGDLQSKVDPYLRPLYDALYDFLGQETVKKHLETGVIEVAPIAYMRGRTLNSVFAVIDESQNAVLDTHLMMLTRLGEGSKMVLTGDVTQIDLPRDRESGLEKCAEILKGIDDIAVIHLNNRDVVRHKLVKEIVKAFEKYEQRKSKPGTHIGK